MMNKWWRLDNRIKRMTIIIIETIIVIVISKEKSIVRLPQSHFDENEWQYSLTMKVIRYILERREVEKKKCMRCWELNVPTLNESYYLMRWGIDWENEKKVMFEQ